MLTLTAASTGPIVETLLFGTELYKSLLPRFIKLVQSKSDRFLNYDPAFLLRSYAYEAPVANGITYCEICNFFELIPPEEEWHDGAIVIDVASKPFARASGTTNWQRTCSAGFTALDQSGRISGNESLIRVVNATVKDYRLHLSLQTAKYHDQAHSNLILDFDRDNPAKYSPLRSQLHDHYGESLPSFNDRRLANTLGVAALIFYKSDGQWIPYIVRRVKKIGVFPGGLHCTSSGAAKWPISANPKTLVNFATKHMLSEIEEEVGLEPKHLVDFRPLSLCREMARGGKPQIFYAGFTLLNRDSLAKRRKEARNVIKATNQWQEIERDRWFRSADIVVSPSRLRTRIGKWGLTLEGAASLHFGLRYAQARLPHLNSLH